jgi:hypothetical protein
MHLDGDQARNQPPMGRRVTVKEAATILGISPEAVRARIKRGTLYKEKGADGTVYVRLDADGTDGETGAQQRRDELIEELRERVRFLESELEDRKEESRRKDTIIMTMAQRIPELEAPSEPREAPETASEEPAKGDDDTEEERRPWWRRLFG